MPGKSCSICAHERCEQITHDILSGRPYKDITEEYGFSAATISRHKQHCTAQMLRSVETIDITEPGVVMRRVMELDQRADYLYREALKQKDLLNANRALKELREIAALYAKLTGELNTQAQVIHQHVHVNPEWVALRQTMLAALTPYPEARAALVAALEKAQALAGGDTLD